MNMYFIALVAPEEINEKLLEWKHFMKDRFGCTVALKSPAHITLVAPFWMQPGLEHDLQNSIHAFSTEQKSFEVLLHNFSAFTPRVIYVDVIKNTAIDSLQNSFTDYLLLQNKFPIIKETRPFHPHVTIATRDLYKKAFNEAWEIFNRKEYNAEWKINSISLLRHNKKNWDVIFTSQFLKK